MSLAECSALRRRSPAPLVIVNDAGGAVAQSDDMPFERLAEDIRELIRRHRRRPPDHAAGSLGPLDGSAALRLVELSGVHESFYAVTLERAESRRNAADGIAAECCLTNREREVLDLVLAGSTTGEISERLFIARTTATDHTRSILRKTGTGKRMKLMARVIAYDGRRSDVPLR